jgi:hypothetical protein
MKKLSVGAAVVVVLIVVVLGPAFLDIYRLQHYMPGSPELHLTLRAPERSENTK